MKKVISLFLVLIFCSNVLADSQKYLIIFTSGAKTVCTIILNEPPSNRMKVQFKNDLRVNWVSYNSIRSIIEEPSQKDVTSEFIATPNPLLSEAPRYRMNSGMSSGSIILVSIAGTFLALILIGALASH